MGLIGIQNLDKGEDRNIFMWAAPIILGCEFLVDWVKHCFVSNFNRIPLSVYSKYTAVLRHDLTTGFTAKNSGGGGSDGTGTRKATRNHAYRVASRIGLVNLPLAVVVVRVLLTQFTRQAASYSVMQLSAVAGMCYICVLAFKMLLGLCLMSHAAYEFNKKRRDGGVGVEGDESGNGSGGFEGNGRRKDTLTQDEQVSGTKEDFFLFFF